MEVVEALGISNLTLVAIAASNTWKIYTDSTAEEVADVAVADVIVTDVDGNAVTTLTAGNSYHVVIANIATEGTTNTSSKDYILNENTLGESTIVLDLRDGSGQVNNVEWTRPTVETVVDGGEATLTISFDFTYPTP